MDGEKKQLKFKPMSKHGNSRENNQLHHLYQIDDIQEKEVFKFGITDDPIEEDGLSKRIRYQINLFNRVAGVFRFTAKIILVNILGRKKAKLIEEDYVKAYEKKYGKRPRGNPK